MSRIGPQDENIEKEAKSMPRSIQFHYEHASAPCCTLDDGALRGLRHRTVIDARGGARRLALWQEEHLAGFRVAPHRHDCEEIITVLEGEITATVESGIFRVSALESVLIPAGALHGFEVTGSRAVRLLALFSSSEPRIFRADGTPSTPPWEGGASDHLNPA